MKKQGSSQGRWYERLVKDRGNYPYATARVKARRAKLIQADMYPKFMLMDLPQVIHHMSETGYRREIDELAGTYSGADLVEYALNRNLARSFQDLRKFTKGQLRDNVEHYLAHWDVHNIKTVLRGNLYNANSSDIMESVVPAGMYDEMFWSELSSLESLEETVAALAGTSYGEPLREALPNYQRYKHLAPLEIALEKHFYGGLLETIGTAGGADELFTRFIRYSIDFTNLNVLFRMKSRGMDGDVVRPYMLDGGDQTHGRMLKEALDAPDLEGLLDACRRLSYYSRLKDAVAASQKEGSLYPIPVLLDKVFHDVSRDFSYRYPLSILPIMDYMIRKENEVRNLRAITRGKSEALPHEQIEAMLIV